ncbi:hypothetical protein J5837_04905 [Pseudoxanthomonas helianthi]|uniref:Uncharacterized protein n=1 Tax=Pseudoxanthomonas helianthi TaxID=1453541 RepID=A0A941ASZ4_9GAMM|nr:hypothetical protein [Pseudoxanthomonas helianthi]MBP3983760.1 hypothetical protein [Pseudoxanthomonas helianthi]
MTIHKMIVGEDLDMLRLPAKRLDKLSPDENCRYNRQRTHNVIRRAWLIHTQTGKDIRDCLDMCCVREYMPESGEMNDRDMNSFALSFGLDDARYCNDWHVGFPFFVEEEANTVFFRHEAGPLLRKHMQQADTPYFRNPLAGMDPDNLRGCAFYCMVFLKYSLEAWRKSARGDDLQLRTVRFIEQVTGRDALLSHTPSELEALFGLAELGLEFIESGGVLLTDEPAMENDKSDGRIAQLRAELNKREIPSTMG